MIIEIKDLVKKFQKTGPSAIDKMTASLPEGKMIGIAGPDGAGKTTLIRLISGLMLPSSGTITVDGFDTVKQSEKIHTFIGYMPQRFGLYEDLTVLQNLNLYADLQGLNPQEKEVSFETLLKFTSLKPFLNRRAKDLSGGMKQKLGLSCALLRKPKLLLLDEPSVGVDPLSRRELWQMVQELKSEGVTIIWSTSYLDEAERCDQVILLNEGKLLYQGPPQELTKRVEGRVYHLDVEGLPRLKIGSILTDKNVVDATVQGEGIRIVVREEVANVNLKPIPPRFEDAFVDMLGGGPKGPSELAEKFRQIETDRKNVVEALGLTKKFGDFTAADHITFSVAKGEIFGLLGPNGAGKSTVFKMMCGLIKPTEGKALVNGKDPQDASGEARAQIGYMAQKFSLYDNLNVGENLEFFSGIYNLTGKKKKDQIQKMVDIFGLKPYLSESTSDLPLGIKQRLALSCAVMHQPEVLFLDEPTSGVDPITRREFWNHINGLVEKGVTVIVTTHFMDEAEYCDRIALIYQGKTVKIGRPKDLKDAVKTKDNPTPSLEDAFIELVEGVHA